MSENLSINDVTGDNHSGSFCINTAVDDLLLVGCFHSDERLHLAETGATDFSDGNTVYSKSLKLSEESVYGVVSSGGSSA
jgi:hypothetical protein